MGEAVLLTHAALAVVVDLSLEDPTLHADGALRRAGLGEAVVDVGAQRVQRNPTFAVPLATAHLGAAETTRSVDADALRAELDRGLHRALERTTESDATLELLRDVLGDELRVDLGLADLLDVDQHLGGRHLLDVLLELLDARAALADDDPRARIEDVDLHL